MEPLWLREGPTPRCAIPANSRPQRAPGGLGFACAPWPGPPDCRGRWHGRRARRRHSLDGGRARFREEASARPVDGFENNMRWARRFMDGLAEALDAMNAVVEAGHGNDGMATTLVAVWVDPDGIRWISVGDSGIWGDQYRTLRTC